jgi:uncharacterized protein (TIGR00299 family) protein
MDNNKILLIDCQASGIAGDMILGALIDLGANTDKIASAIKLLDKPEHGYGNIKIKIEKVMHGNFQATQIDTTSETTNNRHGKELIDIVEKTADTLNLTEKAKQFASKTIRTLVGVEADLHKTSFSDAHLHEVALVDTAAEILGVAVAADDLDLFNSKIYATPVAVGGGTITFSHGTCSVPAPATLAILQSKNYPFQGGPIAVELATPTGVAILVNLVNEVTLFYPALVPLQVGYGAGTKEFEQMPASLRLTLGSRVVKGVFEDEVAVLETSIDDATGEIIGYTIEKLLSDGAKDVNVVPMVTKKNRPGHIIKVIAEQKDAQRLSKVLIEETGTLGVRVCFCQRHIISREVYSVELSLKGNLETVRIKISKDPTGKIIRIKPEYEDLKRLAEKTNTPLRELMEQATEKAKKNLQIKE